MGTFGQTLHADHIESHEPASETRRRLQDIAGRPDDLALLRPRHRCERSAEPAGRPLADLDHGEVRSVETYDVDFSALAAHVARHDVDALGVEIGHGEVFGRRTSPTPQIRHAGWRGGSVIHPLNMQAGAA